MSIRELLDDPIWNQSPATHGSRAPSSPAQASDQASDQELWSELAAAEKRLAALRNELSARTRAQQESSAGVFAETGFVPRSTAERWQDEAMAKFYAAQRELDGVKAKLAALTEPDRRAEAEAEKTKMAANRILAAGAKARAAGAPLGRADLPDNPVSRAMILHNWLRNGNAEQRAMAEAELGRMRAAGLLGS